MFGFWLIVLSLVPALKRARQPRRVNLLYKVGKVVGDEAVFPCGCRFGWLDHEKRNICQAHQALITAELEA